MDTFLLFSPNAVKNCTKGHHNLAIFTIPLTCHSFSLCTNAERKEAHLGAIMDKTLKTSQHLENLLRQNWMVLLKTFMDKPSQHQVLHD